MLKRLNRTAATFATIAILAACAFILSCSSEAQNRIPNTGSFSGVEMLIIARS